MLHDLKRCPAVSGFPCTSLSQFTPFEYPCPGQVLFSSATRQPQRDRRSCYDHFTDKLKSGEEK